MQGIGSLNETARNMFRGPRGIGAYQQFAYGGEANFFGVPSFGQLTGRMPYLPQRDVSNPALSKSGDGIDQYGEYLDSEYGNAEFDQKRDSFLQEVSQQEQQTFGSGVGGTASPETIRPALHVMNQPFMGGALQRGFPSYGIHRQEGFNSSPFGRLRLFKDGGPVYMQEGGEGSVGAAYKDTINKYAEEFLVNPDVLFNLLKTESNFNSKAVNKDSGALGLAQVMPDTADDPGYDVKPLSDPFNAEDSIRFSAEYLSAMLEEFRGDYDLALAAYNAGPGRVRTYRGVPPFAETQKYIEKILGRVAPDEKQGRSGSGVNEQGEQVFTPRPLLRGETGYREELEGMPLKPRMRPSSLSQGIMAAQDTVDPAVIDRVVEQVQEELPPTQEGGDLYEKYSPESMFPDAGLRPPSVEFGEDKGGVFRSLMPPRRPKKEYPGNDTDALMRGLSEIRGRTLRKGFTPYVQDVRGELT